MEFCYSPFTLQEALRASLAEPPATLLVLPNGWVKVSAVLPQICADLRLDTLEAAWKAYRSAWGDDAVVAAAHRAIADSGYHAQSSRWQRMTVSEV